MTCRLGNIRFWLAVLTVVGLSTLAPSCQVFSERQAIDSHDSDSQAIDTADILAPCQENITVITLVAGPLEGAQSCEYAEKK